MDPNDPVIKLCSEGMQAEMQGRLADARALFLQAWEQRKDDYDACVVAHFLARNPEDPREMLHWNEEALKYADAVGDERVMSFYPSLYLNLGYSHETLGDLVEAKRYYDLAAEKADDLPEGSYGEMIRNGIAEGLKRARGFPAFINNQS